MAGGGDDGDETALTEVPAAAKTDGSVGAPSEAAHRACPPRGARTAAGSRAPRAASGLSRTCRRRCKVEGLGLSRAGGGEAHAAARGLAGPLQRRSTVGRSSAWQAPPLRDASSHPSRRARPTRRRCRPPTAAAARPRCRRRRGSAHRRARRRKRPRGRSSSSPPSAAAARRTAPRAAQLSPRRAGRCPDGPARAGRTGRTRRRRERGSGTGGSVIGGGACAGKYRKYVPFFSAASGAHSLLAAHGTSASFSTWSCTTGGPPPRASSDSTT